MVCGDEGDDAEGGDGPGGAPPPPPPPNGPGGPGGSSGSGGHGGSSSSASGGHGGVGGNGGTAAAVGPPTGQLLGGGQPRTRAQKRQEEEEAEAARVRAGVTLPAGAAGARVNLPLDHPLAPVGLPGMLVDAAPRLARRCGARVWRMARRNPVLGQRSNVCKQGGEEFCGTHRAEADRSHGVWDPEVEHRTLARDFPMKFDGAVREARRREVLAQAAHDAAVPPVEEADSEAAAQQRQRAPILQPPFVPSAPGELRVFDKKPYALPPFPCRLCAANFATQNNLMRHIDECHEGWAEYRKRMFYLASQVGAVRPVAPQEWRMCVEAFAEHLVTGSSEWPACDSRAGVAVSQDKPQWWKAGPLRLLESPVRLESLGPSVDPAHSCSQEAEEPRERRSRRAIRHRVACCVCARLHWEEDVQRVFFWRQPARGEEPSFIRDTKRAARGGSSPRRRAQALLCPGRYYRRWRFAREGPDGEIVEGGIPLAELEASCVRDPGDGGLLWLAHKKSFRMLRRPGGEVADPSQRVPVCVSCRAALGKEVPTMPKYALANDLWIGRLPPALSGLSTGARLLLPWRGRSSSGTTAGPTRVNTCPGTR